MGGPDISHHFETPGPSIRKWAGGTRGEREHGLSVLFELELSTQHQGVCYTASTLRQMPGERRTGPSALKAHCPKTGWAITHRMFAILSSNRACVHHRSIQSLGLQI